jgi:hypothetical protein
MSGVRASFWLSRLGDARERRRAIRWLVTLALGGFGLTMFVLIASGRGTDRWFFILVVWLALIFIPLWLVTAAFETLGPALRVRMARHLAGRLDRYGRLPGTAVLVEDLFAKQVVMPRITTPPQAYKAREAAVALVVLAHRQPPALETLQEVVGRCLVGVEAWARDLGGWTAASAPENIQARWGTVRALAALAALSKTLVAVYEDRSGRDLWPDLDDRSLHAFLDAALDYCDELALQVEVTPWEEPALGLPADPEAAAHLRHAWQRYVDAPQPAPAALQAFLGEVLPGLTV